MILRPASLRIPPAVALAAVLLCAGCAGEGLAVLADNCWGQGLQSQAECTDAQRRVLRALGHDGVRLQALVAGQTCNNPVDCKKLAAGTKSERRRSTKSTASDRPAASAASGAARAAGATEARSPAKEAVVDAVPSPRAGDRGADAGATSSPASAPAAAPPVVGEAAAPAVEPQQEPKQEKVAAVPSDRGSCDGIDISALEQRSDLSGAERKCLMDASTGKADVSSPEVQVAAITLYNTKSSGWKKAVESALKQKNLKNAPQLNFAGIKTAYDSNKYSRVIRRSTVVWKNRGKGYQLSAKDLTFVTEFACRSALQLHLMQRSDPAGFVWCERWQSRLSKSGDPTAEVDDILYHLED